MREDMIYGDEMLQRINDEKEFVIYGAGTMGKALKRCLVDEPYNKGVTCFIVGCMEHNPAQIDGIRVIDMAHAEKYKNHTVLVALHERHLHDAVADLHTVGFTDVVPVSFDSDLWSHIRGNWFRMYRIKMCAPYIPLEAALRPDLHIYVVNSVYDRVLHENMDYLDHEIPIQVGAALTDRQICAVRDDLGENISDRNKQYCELTALYWIWKHDNAGYAGISHYRRRFKIDGGQAEKLISSGVDVVVTVPVLNFGSVKGQYGKDHDEKDWDTMMEAIKLLCPHYYEAAKKVQAGIYYYAYNMFIARKEILNDYCAWLFPILFYCEKKIGTKADAYQNRYIGFLAERLLTVYLEHNRQLCVAVADKHFIEV